MSLCSFHASIHTWMKIKSNKIIIDKIKWLQAQFPFPILQSQSDNLNSALISYLVWWIRAGFSNCSSHHSLMNNWSKVFRISVYDQTWIRDKYYFTCHCIEFSEDCKKKYFFSLMDRIFTCPRVYIPYSSTCRIHWCYLDNSEKWRFNS